DLSGAAVLSTVRDGADEIDPGTAQAVLESLSAAGETAIVDLPRQLTPAARAAVVLADRVLLIVPAEVRAGVAAAMIARQLITLTDRVEVVVRTGSGAQLQPPAIASALGLPLAGSLRSAAGVTAALDRGEFPSRKIRGSLGGLCRSLLAAEPVRTAS
ncbi:MAG TPA: hypothetical protein VHC49_10030, partial [Mycobacteriales bacterium]|nr:hypothetical protein [Mycobacteriales bacterium]